MNYKKIYDNLVDSCRSRGLNKKKVSFYTEKHHILPRSMGGDNSKTNLVLFTAREHLVAHKLLWYMFKEDRRMQLALHMMTKGKGVGLSSRQFKVLREQNVASNLGQGNPFFGKSHTEEAKRKTGLAAKGRAQTPEARERTRLSNLGAKRSEKAKENMSAAAKAKKLRPWQVSGVMTKPISLSIWAQASHHYDFWLAMGKLHSRKYTSAYNTVFNDTLVVSNFNVMIKYFKDGWVPTLDADWLSFEHNYFKME